MRPAIWCCSAIIAIIILVCCGRFLAMNRTSNLSENETRSNASAGAPQGDLSPEAGYGTVTGQFILEGEIPLVPPAGSLASPNGRDILTCGGTTIPNERLVVDQSSKGIANIFIYLSKAPANTHPKLVNSQERIIQCTQKMCRYAPRSLIVRIDQTVQILSEDPVLHSFHPHPLRNPDSGRAMHPKLPAVVNVNFRLTENIPIEVRCDVHPWMTSHWLILDHPYSAVTDEHGKFAIGKLPAGEHDFIIWHEAAGYLTRKFTVTVPENGIEARGPMMLSLAKFKL